MFLVEAGFPKVILYSSLIWYFFSCHYSSIRNLHAVVEGHAFLPGVSKISHSLIHGPKEFHTLRLRTCFS